MARISAILFDKDGTLFDFEATWGAWARQFLSELARGDRLLETRLSDALLFDMNELSFDPGSPVIAGTPGDIAELLLPHLPGANPSSLINHMNVTAAKAPQTEIVPLNPLLSGLRESGQILGVATNDAELPARAHLDTAGILDHFDHVFGSDSGFGGKPHPGPCLAFADAIRIRPAQVAMVGDSRHDLLAGRAAGMVTVAVTSGLAPRDVLAPLADVVLDDISHIPGWLTTVNAPEFSAA